MSAYPSSFKVIKQVKINFTFVVLLFLSACGGGGGGGGTTVTSASSTATFTSSVGSSSIATTSSLSSSSAATTSSSSTSTSSAVSAAPILSDVRLDKTLSGFIAAGTAYSGKVVVTPIDSRNSIVSYKIQNPTVLGGLASINSQGEVQWIPNDVDINTKSLKLTVVMKEGTEQSVELPVSVHVSKQLFEVELKPDQTQYSDEDGAVTFQVETVDGSSISGKVTVYAQRDIDGNLNYGADVSNEKVFLHFIEVPTIVSKNYDKVFTQSESAAPGLLEDLTAQLGVIGAAQWIYPTTCGDPLLTVGYETISYQQFKQCDYASSSSVMPLTSQTKRAIQVDGTCDGKAIKCTRDGTPIILIHGFNYPLNVGGGDGTWGGLASHLISNSIASPFAKHDVFDFRWITYMPFEEAAGQLAFLIKNVTKITGKKPTIVAHSFGGIVANLALAGEGVYWRSGRWEKQVGVDENVKRLITLGSPLWGISPDRVNVNFEGNVFPLVAGRDKDDVIIFQCGAVTCIQAGAIDLVQGAGKKNLLKFQNIAAYWRERRTRFSGWSSVENEKFRATIRGEDSSLTMGESIARLYIHQHGVPSSIVVGVNSDKDVFSESSIREIGDNLISMMGQIYPGDFSEDSFPLRDIANGSPENMFQMKKNGREYFFLPGAVHTSNHSITTQFHILEADLGLYRVAYCKARKFDLVGCESQGMSDHHLVTMNSAQYSGSGQVGLFREEVGFVTNTLKPWKSNFSVVSVCDPFKICTQSSNGIAILPLTIELRNKSTGGVVSSARFYTDAEGFVEPDLNNFIDTKANGFNRADYKIQITLGDGVTYDIKKVVVDDITADVVQVPDIVLQKKGTAGTGTLFGRALDKANQPLANIQVRLKAGINLGAGDFTNIAPSTTARIVKTDANGYFSVSGLRATEFSAEFISARTKHKFDSGIIVPSGSSLTKDFILEATYCDSPFVLKNGGCTNSTPVTVPIPEFVPIPGKNFSMSKYETTFAEYDAYAEETGVAKPSDQGFGRGNRPVITVSWDDAVAYAAWLSKKTGKNYRLPTEEEWEFAARAGTTTNYSWGNDVGVNNANCNGCGSQWDGQQTAPVGSFKPNSFGLFDMHGNITEWTQGCWEGDCVWRVLRGGSWGNVPDYMRSSFRGYNSHTYRISSFGFRLLQDESSQTSLFDFESSNENWYYDFFSSNGHIPNPRPLQISQNWSVTGSSSGFVSVSDSDLINQFILIYFHNSDSGLYSFKDKKKVKAKIRFSSDKTVNDIYIIFNVILNDAIEPVISNVGCQGVIRFSGSELIDDFNIDLSTCQRYIDGEVFSGRAPYLLDMNFSVRASDEKAAPLSSFKLFIDNIKIE